MDWLIATAAAQASGAGGGANMMGTLLFPVAMIAVFYFLLIRPQNKKAKEHRQMVATIEAGAEVATNGGILGKVTEVGEHFISVEIAEGVNVKVQRHTIAQVLPKGTLKAS